MKTYKIGATVDTIDLTVGDQQFQGKCLVPNFEVHAENEREAEQLALEIIDPLDLTGVTVTVTEIQSNVETLTNELQNAIEALNGDSNDQEHDALWSMATVVAAVLGMDLYKLMDME